MLERDATGRIRLCRYRVHPTRSSEWSTKCWAGIEVFDGHGNLTQRDYRGDSLRLTGQTDFAPEGRETGTYIVNSDCTGSMVINLNVPNTPPPHGVINTVFVISSAGRHIYDVVSEFTPPGFTTPQPTQTSSDHWKVGSEQND